MNRKARAAFLVGIAAAFVAVAIWEIVGVGMASWYRPAPTKKKMMQANSSMTADDETAMARPCHRSTGKRERTRPASIRPITAASARAPQT